MLAFTVILISSSCDMKNRAVATTDDNMVMSSVLLLRIWCFTPLEEELSFYNYTQIVF